MKLAGLLDKPNVVMCHIWLRLVANWLRNKLLQVGRTEVAYTHATAAYTQTAEAYTHCHCENKASSAQLGLGLGLRLATVPKDGEHQIYNIKS
jgi:hypothetical protein